MLALIVFALIGTTLVVTRSTLFEPLQKLWPAFFRCSQCFGMWVGSAAGATGVVAPGHGIWLDGLIVGAATSFLALLADAVLMKLLGDPEETL